MGMLDSLMAIDAASKAGQAMESVEEAKDELQSIKRILQRLESAVKKLQEDVTDIKDMMIYTPPQSGTGGDSSLVGLPH